MPTTYSSSFASLNCDSALIEAKLLYSGFQNSVPYQPSDNSVTIGKNS